MNVIQNGDFSDGFYGWVSSGGADTGGAVVDDPTQPGNPVFFLGAETRKAQGPFAVEPGDVWRILYRVIAPRDTSYFGVTSGGTSWVPGGNPTVAATGGEWQQVDYTVTIPGSGVSGISARFACGTPGGFYVDDVELHLVERGGSPS